MRPHATSRSTIRRRKRRLDFASRTGKFERKIRIDRLGLGGLSKLRNHFFGLAHVEHRQRRAAVSAARSLDEIDRRAAIGAVHRLDVAPHPSICSRGQRPDEVLLAKKLEKGDEPPVLVRAAVVGERACCAACRVFPVGATGSEGISALPRSLPCLCDDTPPIRVKSLRVEAGESWRLSRWSNQNAWQPKQTSMLTVRPVMTIQRLNAHRVRTARTVHPEE